MYQYHTGGLKYLTFSWPFVTIMILTCQEMSENGTIIKLKLDIMLPPITGGIL